MSSQKPLVCVIYYMKTILRNIINKGYSINLKQDIIKYYLEHGESATVTKYVITRSALNQWLAFKEEILKINPKEITEEIVRKRVRGAGYREKYQQKFNPSNRRKKHPFVVISGYINSNYKLVCFRNKMQFEDSDLIKPIDLWRLAKKQKCTCSLSGRKLTPENVSADHIIPVSRGGKNHPTNLRLVISDINKMRNNHKTEYFIELCKSVAHYNK